MDRPEVRGGGSGIWAEQLLPSISVVPIACKFAPTGASAGKSRRSRACVPPTQVAHQRRRSPSLSRRAGRGVRRALLVQGGRRVPHPGGELPPAHRTPGQGGFSKENSVLFPSHAHCPSSTMNIIRTQPRKLSEPAGGAGVPALAPHPAEAPAGPDRRSVFVKATNVNPNCHLSSVKAANVNSNCHSHCRFLPNDSAGRPLTGPNCQSQLPLSRQ